MITQPCPLVGIGRLYIDYIDCNLERIRSPGVTQVLQLTSLRLVLVIFLGAVPRRPCDVDGRGIIIVSFSSRVGADSSLGEEESRLVVAEGQDRQDGNERRGSEPRERGHHRRLRVRGGKVWGREYKVTHYHGEVAS